MVYRRLLALCGLVSLFLFYSCTDGSSPVDQSSTGRAVVALSTVFPEGTTAEQTADITRIRITVKRVSDDSVVGVFVTDVGPTLEVWTIHIEVEIPPDNPLVYLVTELISVFQGIETVEYSGITAGFSLTDQTAAQQVEVVQGPVANNFVTSVTLVEAGPVTEGDGLQLQAQVHMSQPGAPTLLWESADLSIATVTQGGFLQAHLPGTARISVTAGAQSDETSVVVLARPIGLAFVSQPSSVEVGEPLDPAPSVEVVDARGDRVGSYVGAVTLELEDRAAALVAAAAATAPGVVGAPQVPELGGTTTVDAVEGLATFEGLVVPEGGLFRLVATAQGLNPAASEDFEVMLMTADLAVTKEVDKPTALEGDQVTFTVTVVNNGPATATGVTVSDPQPLGLLFETVTPSHGSYSPVGAWDVGTLTNGEAATLTIVATVGQGTGGQSLENVASASQLTEQNDDPENNQASALVDVGRRVADIAVTKEADQVEVRETEAVVFTVSVLNHGPDRADQIVVTDNLPNGLGLLSADPGFNPSTGEWIIQSLEPGALVRLTITAVVAQGFAGETLTNTATAAVLEHQEDDPSNNSGAASILALPVVSVPENHAFKTAGNTQLIGGNFGGIVAVKTNSLTKNTPSLTVTSLGPFSTNKGGTVTIEPDGDFLYTPPLNNNITDSFQYTVAGGGTATVTIDVVDMVWYLDNRVGLGSGTGASEDPFGSIVDFEFVVGPAAGHTIFFHTGDGTTLRYDTGITLLDNQKLLGEGVGLTIAGLGTIVPAGVAPKITNVLGDAVTLGSGNTVSGLTIDAPLGAAISGSEISGGTVDQVNISNPAGAGISLITATGTFTFNSLDVQGSGSFGVNIQSSGGTFTFTDLSIAGGSDDAFRVNGGSPTVDVNVSAGGISNVAAFRRVLLIQSTTGGTVTFNGGSITDDGGTGIDISSTAGAITLNTPVILTNTTGSGVEILNASAPVTFADLDVTNPPPILALTASLGSSIGLAESGARASLGGPDSGVSIQGSTGTVTFGMLHISTGNEAALEIFTSGMVRVTDPSSTLSASADLALDVSSSGLDMTFASVSSSSSPVQGIRLNSTTGTLTMNGGSIGTASAASVRIAGGSANVTYNGTLTGFSGFGAIDIQNNTGGTLTFGGLITDAGPGINLLNNTGTTINFNGGLDLDTGANTAFSATGGGTVNVTGTNTVSTTIGIGINIQNTDIGGSGVTFQSVSVSGATNGIVLTNTGSGDFAVTGTGAAGSDGSILNTTGRCIDISGGGGTFTFTSLDINNSMGSGIFLSGTSGTFALQNSTVTNTGNSGVSLVIGNGNVTFDVTGNTFIGNPFAAVDLFGDGPGLLSGSIIGNTMSGPLSSAGVDMFFNGGADGIVRIFGNSFSDGAHGVLASVGSSPSDDSKLDLTVDSEIISLNLSSLTPGIDVTANEATTLCTNIRANTISLGGPNAIELRQNSSSTVSIEGLNGGSGSVSNPLIVASFLESVNPLSPAGAFVGVATFMLGVGTGTCRTP